MGQAIRKLTGRGRSPSSSALRRPMESRFQDPRLRGHLPGDVYPTPPDAHPGLQPDDESREWDRDDPMYSIMAKKLSGTVVTRPEGTKPAPVGMYLKRPLPKDRHSTGQGPDENVIVAPGSLNVGHIRQLFLSYQAVAEGDKQSMDTKAFADKYNVDIHLLEKVLQFYEMPKKKEDTQTGQSAASSTSKQG